MSFLVEAGYTKASGGGTGSGEPLPRGDSSSGGGGGITDTVTVDGTEVTFGHGGRHLDVTGLSAGEVNNAIANDVAGRNLPKGQFYKGVVKVNGIAIEYRAYGLGNGRVNVGTYIPR